MVTHCITLLAFLLTDMESEIIPEDDEEYDDIVESDNLPPQGSTEPIDDDIYEELPGIFIMLHNVDTFCRSTEAENVDTQSKYKEHVLEGRSCLQVTYIQNPVKLHGFG